jgi:hypothetical protein
MKEVDAGDQGVDTDRQAQAGGDFEQGAVVADAEQHVGTGRAEIGEEAFD